MAKPTKHDELKRHAAYLIAWCGAIRASTYVLQAIFGASGEEARD